VIVLLVVTALTVLVAVIGAVTLVGRPRSTTDFLVASQAVPALWNTSALTSEFISVAAFLGTAGLVLAYGIDMLWLPIGAAAGHVVLQAFVTAPLRRSGTFTLLDFAEWRLGSRVVQKTVSACVCFIGWFYLLPQFQSAGVTLRVVAGLPVWVGWAVVVVVALAIVFTGGMRGITVMRAFRFWLKLVAVAIPAVALVAVWHLDSDHDPSRPESPYFVHDTTVAIDLDVAIRVPVGTGAEIAGVLDGERYDGDHVVLEPGTHVLGEGTRLTFPAGATVPHATRLPLQSGDNWAMPFGRGGDHPLFTTYSVLIGMLLGTMGLPQVVVRFCPNTCGRAARRTAAMVPALLALFCIFPTLYGALGRLYAPGLLMTGDGDATILMLPHRLAPGLPGSLLTGLIAAGAFAAFTSASCGIVVAIAGSISQCVPRGGVKSFRISALIAITVPLTLVAWIGPLGSAGLVTLACAVSACSLCPLLVLGVWWRRLTPVGAAAGLVVGCALAVMAALAHIFGGPRDGWSGALLGQPTIVIVPVTFAVMVLVSLLTPLRVPAGVDRVMARLHLPEELTTDRSR
jgi:Na+(H+)/acetate symporter ActP